MSETKTKGSITELECMTAFLKLGCTVLTPYGEDNRYDFVAEVQGRFIRIQCKTSRPVSNGAAFSFGCRSRNYRKGKLSERHYTDADIDYFATSFGGKVYVIPVDECYSEKTLRLEPAKNNQVSGVVEALNYEISHFFARLFSE